MVHGAFADARALLSPNSIRFVVDFVQQVAQDIRNKSK